MKIGKNQPITILTKINSHKSTSFHADKVSKVSLFPLSTQF